MDMGYTSGPTGAYIKAIGIKIKLAGTASTIGMMAECIRVIGRIITCMVRAFISGLMDESMKESM